MRVGGAFLGFTHHTTTRSPPSLQTRVGGVVFSLHPPHHHPFPLPRFKRESEGVFLVFTHHTTTISPPSLQARVGGVILSLHPPYHHPVPPPSLQMRVGGVFLVFTHHHSSPSLASNASRRDRFKSRPLPRFKCESEGRF